MIGLQFSAVADTPAEQIGAGTADLLQLAQLRAENARFERDLQMAADIQRALLPAPRYAGSTFDLAAASAACRTVGGDFFDYIELADGSFGFVLCDVEGKGLAAALLTTVVQSIFAAHASRAGGPAKTVARVNDGLLRRAIGGRFATMFYGVLSADGRLSYCNAGHEPPVLIGHDGVQLLQAGGLVLGLFEHADYEAGAVQLTQDDVLVVCSDGCTEAHSPEDEEFGRERLVASISACRGSQPQAILERLFECLNLFTAGSPQFDDVTALVLRYRGR